MRILSYATMLVLLLFVGCTTKKNKHCPNTTEYIDVTLHGVIPDDGQEDTDAIRNVFLNIRDASKHSTIFFPEGTYLLNPDSLRSMEIVDNCTTVTGVKGRSIFKLVDNSLDPTLICPHDIKTDFENCISVEKQECRCKHFPISPVRRMLEAVMLGNVNRKDMATGNHDITIQNLTFDSNCRNNPLQDDPCYQNVDQNLSFWAVRDLTIEDCQVFNACQAAIKIVDGRHSLIQNNYIFDIGQGVKNADGIQVNGSRHTLILNNLLENTGEGIFCQHWEAGKLQDQPDRNCTIEDNIIRIVDYNGQCLGPGIPYACCTGPQMGDSISYPCRRGIAKGSSIGLLTQNSAASGNYIYRHAPMTVNADIVQANVDTRNVQVYKNTFVEIARYKVFSGGAIWLVSSEGLELDDIEVYDNIIIDSYCSGISLAYSSKSDKAGELKKIEIKNNQVFGACLAVGDTFGYYLNGTNCLPRIFNNCAGIIFQNGAFAHDVPRFRNIVVNNNQVSDINRYAIWLEEGGRNLQFTNNHFYCYRDGFFNAQCVKNDASCGGKNIRTFKNNNPIYRTDLLKIVHVMPNNADLRNVCIDCTSPTCGAGLAGGNTMARLQSGSLMCQ